MNMFDFNEIPAEGERWMLFAKDFMQQLGFHIESPPHRDPDGKYDFVAVEQVPGKFNLLPFRWLVSCQHKASTRTAVKESDEIDILERVLRCRADGFIGFYSTPISASLENRIAELKDKAQIKDYRLFDAKSLESYLTSPAFGRVVARYFPGYVKTYGVLHLVGDEYLPIRCEHCNKDLLEAVFNSGPQGVVVGLRRRKKALDEMEVVADLYAACKGTCDEQLQSKYCNGTTLDAAEWIEIFNLVSPPMFLERLMALVDRLGNDEVIFSPQALEKEKYLIRALAQYVLRDFADGERQWSRKVTFNG